jgi:sterol desaturase/sphingolipid hydroxylase (fatty acid hydroxylase superfamily)
MLLVRFSSFWIYPSLTLLLIHTFFLYGGERWWIELLFLVLSGLLIWSLLEYVLHRFFFHYRPRSHRIRRLLKQLHFAHHSDPKDREKILVRPVYSLSSSGCLLFFFYLPTGDFLQASAVLAGVWVGFLYYELVHYRLHLSLASGGLLKYQRRCHFYHHFVDHNRCFGVTSPLWDLVFGTFCCCPETGEG